MSKYQELLSGKVKFKEGKKVNAFNAFIKFYFFIVKTYKMIGEIEFVNRSIVKF